MLMRTLACRRQDRLSWRRRVRAAPQRWPLPRVLLGVWHDVHPCQHHFVMLLQHPQLGQRLTPHLIISISIFSTVVAGGLFTGGAVNPARLFSSSIICGSSDGRVEAAETQVSLQSSLSAAGRCYCCCL